MSIPRSTQAGRGELAGPASTPRQVRAITVLVEQVAPGVLKISQAFGWTGGLARTPGQLASLVATAFVEAQVAAYSGWRGHQYDRANTDPTRQDRAVPAPRAYRRPKPARRGRRVDVHDPQAWVLAGDGRWIDPGSGRHWRPDSQTVQRVQARRVSLGLSASPDPVDTKGNTGVLRGTTR